MADVIGSNPARPTRGAVLRPRERALARRVARGLSNRQIAEELVISPGSSGLHVKNMLGRLGFSSRTQIAVWAVERGLVVGPDDARD